MNPPVPDRSRLSRRRFLLATVAAAPLAVIGRPSRLSAGIVGCQRASYPSVIPLTTPTESDPFVDGRPVFSPDGRTVLFMRGPLPSGEPSALYTISIDGGEAQQIEPVDCPSKLSLSRPDWSWRRRSHEIAFQGNLPALDGAPAQSNIYLLDVATSACRLVLQGITEDNQIYSYPTWYPDGRRLSITNYWFALDAQGCSEHANPQQLLLQLDVVEGALLALTSPLDVWPGMSSVAQVPFAPSIAFAGERPIAGGKYCQDDNQIWIRTARGKLRQVDGQQGRAPWWSPAGALIAFESNRCSADPQSYRIFIQSPARPALITPVTPPDLPVQHAKWSPDGRKLVFAYGASAAGAGIAYVDLRQLSIPA